MSPNDRRVPGGFDFDDRRWNLNLSVAWIILMRGEEDRFRYTAEFRNRVG